MTATPTSSERLPATLLVVAKAPVPGEVKTRLTTALTPEQAADVAAAALLDTLDAVLATPVATRVVAMTGDLRAAARADEVRAALASCVVVPQRGEGFAARLAAAHADAASHGATPVLQVGMDTPQVDAALLTASTLALLAPGVDAVLGPAEDGGWWALGVRGPELAAGLAGVPMSRPDTGALTRAALLAAGARLGADLPALRDVDTPADTAAVAALAPGSRFAAAVAALPALAGAGVGR